MPDETILGAPARHDAVSDRDDRALQGATIGGDDRSLRGATIGGDDRSLRDDVAVPPEAIDVDRRRARGRRTRESILEAAVDLASVEGLDGLTIGRLASELGMSKSGLFAHFGSKEELQLAAIDTARDIYVREVIAPAREAERGLPRLVSLMDHWLDYLRGEVFKGGCFFDATRNEYDSRQPGPVRDAIKADFASWLEILANRVRAAQAAGHLDPEADPEQLAFELDALGGAANVRYQLDGNEIAFDRARAAIHARLDALRVHG